MDFRLRWLVDVDKRQRRVSGMRFIFRIGPRFIRAEGRQVDIQYVFVELVAIRVRL